MECIYIDVLIILNWYINYFVLLGTAKITHTGFKRKRFILSALIGAFSSLIILLPPMGYLMNVVIKLVISVILVTIAFGKKDIFTTLKIALYFCVISFLFAGVIISLKELLNSSVISTNNSYVYANFSIGFLVISTTVCYALLCLIRYLIDKNTGATGDWSLNVTYNQKSVTIKGFADTGNALIDSFSGKPVIICSQQSLKSMVTIPNLDEVSSLKGFRLIPFSTISQGGLIVSFIPDSVTITNNVNGYSKSVDALIGISGNSQMAIFNPKILI